MYKVLKHIAIICFLTTLQQQLFGVEGKPKMRRACLDKSDSTITLLWFPPSDNCVSFTSFNLYGREDALSIFKHLGRYTSFSLNSVQIKMPHLKTDWEFYLVYSKACNGTDSIYSDTIGIDITSPTNSTIDSVSVDFITQTTVIGWKQNPSKDIKGYVLYFITGTNSIIDNTSNTFANDLDPGRNPSNASYSYGIAAYDSCNNRSIISPIHKTIHLRSTYDQCKKTIDLNWANTGYSGWAVQSYDIFLSINNGSYKKISTILDLSITGFTYSFLNFGDNYCFYIRAFKQGENVSSSSNMICVATNSVIAPKNSYIAKVSVQNEAVDLTLITQVGTDLQKVNVYKSEDNGPFSLWQSVNTTGGTLELTDNQVKIHTKNYKYYFVTLGPCNNPPLIFDSSQICETILLTLQMNSPGDQDLKWNSYYEFKKNTEKQEMLLINTPNANKGSTWNILNSFSPLIISANDTTNFGTAQEQLCYCIRAIENSPNQFYPRQDTSYSNIECATADPIVYFPNAIQINGFNTVFYPQGVFIDYDKSSFQIFNRWGQMVFETTDIRKGWNGEIASGIAEADIFAYRSMITGINGKQLIFDGTVTVLK